MQHRRPLKRHETTRLGHDQAERSSKAFRGLVASGHWQSFPSCVHHEETVSEILFGCMRRMTGDYIGVFVNELKLATVLEQFESPAFAEAHYSRPCANIEKRATIVEQLI